MSWSYGRAWTVEIRNNVITRNQAVSQGGGIYFGGQVLAIIEDNDIRDNVITSGDGGGISLLTWVSGSVVTRNAIVDNLAGDHGGGLIVAAWGQESFVTTISWNLIAANTAHQKSRYPAAGGGILLSHLDAKLTNNTIVANRCDDGSGGGIAVQSPGTSEIAGNIVAFNQGGAGIMCEGGGRTDIHDNLIWGNTADPAEYGCGGRNEWNLLEDPLFCDPENDDYHVAGNSPALTDSMTFGCYPEPGCSAISAPTTWNRILSKYR